MVNRKLSGQFAQFFIFARICISGLQSLLALSIESEIFVHQSTQNNLESFPLILHYRCGIHSLQYVQLLTDAKLLTNLGIQGEF